MLNARAPTIAPTVFAAYTRPTSRPGSCPGVATAASASGKLAPQRQAAGSTAHRQRTRSSCRLNQGLCDSRGLIGQYGSDEASCQAVHEIATASSNWQNPSA